MVAAGLIARIKDGRHTVALAIVDGDQALDHLTSRASAGEDTAAQLRRLEVDAHELMRSHGVTRLVVWSRDPAPGGKGRFSTSLGAGRAEGAVLAAAGQLADYGGSVEVSGAAIREAGGGDTNAAVAALCAGVTGVPSDAALQRAVAAVRAVA